MRLEGSSHCFTTENETLLDGGNTSLLFYPLLDL